MRALFFDTETTGLPKQRNISASQDASIWPDPVSISWIVTEESKIFRAKSFIIKPSMWTIPQESINIHGISQEMAEKNGVDINHVLGEFIRDLRQVDIVIAHNIDFDKNVIIAATIKSKHDHALVWPSREFCTMEASRQVCKIPLTSPNALFKYKAPKLSELYKYITKQESPKVMLHSSLGDVMVLYELFFTHWTLENISIK